MAQQYIEHKNTNQLSMLFIPSNLCVYREMTTFVVV